MTENEIQDVLIIGGGPVGSTLGTLLAREGRKVMLLEREKFPRDHVGESLLPFCFPLLKDLGVVEKLKMMAVRKPGVRFMNPDASEQTTWCFNHVIKDESALSFHVFRADFDQLLLNNSREKGVEVHEETMVTDVQLERPDGLVSATIKGPDGMEKEVLARYLADCSGQKTFLATKLGTKKPDPNFDRTATFGHWTGYKPLPMFDEGLLAIVNLGGEKKGWIWCIPIALGRISIGLVINNEYMKKTKRALKEQGSTDTTRDFYVNEIMSAPFLADLLENAEVANMINTAPNYSYQIEKKYGHNWSMVGDAATFIDPIFASGIFLGMKSASLVAGAIGQKLDQTEGALTTCTEALDKVYATIQGSYKLLYRVISSFYNPNSLSWAEMGGAADIIHEKHQTALAIGHFLLAGDFFDRHEEYQKVLDLMQDPKIMKKYKQLVLNRGNHEQTGCGLKRNEVFPELVREAAERARSEA